jgi:pimeloyl-ACP methyl ester carboxylesterase
MAGWAHHVANLPGLKVHYLRQGAGFPLILLHGWPEFCLAWRKNIPALAREFDVVAPDLRGFGETEKPSGAPSVEAYVDDLEALADNLALPRFGLVSHDVGAYVAQAFARRAPERVAGLFFFDCPYPGIGNRWAGAEHLKEIWYQSFHQLDWAAELVGSSRDACRLYLRHFLGHWAHDPHAFDEDLDAWVDNFMKPGNLRGGFDWYRAANAARTALIRDGAPELPRIETPSRFLWGASDPIVKADWVDRLPDYFAGPRIDVVAEAGHFVFYEKPELANREILEFFKDLIV